MRNPNSAIVADIISTYFVQHIDSQILAVLYPGRRLQRDHGSDELSNDVVFRLTATSAAKNFWTGVYFGEEEPVSGSRFPASPQFPSPNIPALIQFDAIGLFVRNGQIGLVDAHLPAGEEATVSCTTIFRNPASPKTRFPRVRISRF